MATEQRLGVTGEDWTSYEVDLVVSRYLSLYVRAAKGENFSKAQVYRDLAGVLKVRSADSVALKMSNISSVMLGLGWPNLPGMGPLPNIQHVLVDHVSRAIKEYNGLDNLDEAAIRLVTRTPASGPLEIVLASQIPKMLRLGGAFSTDLARGIRRDYVELEARNSSLGLAGELAVLDFEEKRLSALGARKLANKIEHVSVIRGDGLGYDIHSFEVDGRDKLIEVKTTTGSGVIPFYVSSNELKFSREFPEYFCLSRVFDFPTTVTGRKKVQLYELNGSLSDTCDLHPESYKALPRAEMRA
ncbi:hypothetical protein CQ017_03965 [Arthrobacter sp. MYb224]|uniref:DUF3883 domain-containing protein n=1 Tax=Arthrobacter sp. MYb224 TaxID=1848600 RepID=UPI000CFB0B8D|nr:DUF3883 domain-containing protein [Arthrobacter sp. MYb224]PRA00196.1 hypothetical protein CQ017_03965 [Arthrobacter sp. MYb224]